MNYVFGSCSSLTKLNVSNFNTNLVEDMSDVFYQWVKIKSLDLSKFNTSLVYNMNSMFSLCYSL